MKSLILALGVLLLPNLALAEKSVVLGDVEVHYNALPTSDLRPEVARAYNIERSRTNGMITVAVLRKNSLGVAAPVRAQVKVNSITLASQLATVPMRTVEEGPAIYYIGQYKVTAPETLRFKVNVILEGDPVPRSFDFQQEFFPD